MIINTEQETTLPSKETEEKSIENKIIPHEEAIDFNFLKMTATQRGELCVNEIVKKFNNKECNNDSKSILKFCYQCFRKYKVPFVFLRSKTESNIYTVYFHCICSKKRKDSKLLPSRKEHDENIYEQDQKEYCGAKFTIKIVNETMSIVGTPSFKHNHDSSVGCFDNSYHHHTFSKTENKEIRETIKKVGVNETIKIYKDDKISREKIRNVRKSERGIMRQEDDFLCEYPVVEDDEYIRVTNLTFDRKLDNFIVINKKLCKYKCNHYQYYIDDTVGIDINNKVMVCISTLSPNNKIIILAFGIIQDKKTESFKKFFSKYKEIVPIDPVVINVDRCEAQKNALIETYPNTHLIYCSIHIRRNISQNFKEKIILDFYDQMMNGQLHENIFLAFLIEIVKKKCLELYNEKFSSIQLPELPPEMIISLEKFDIVPKLGSLIKLIEDREHFFPSYSEQFALYNKNTTNSIETVFATIKRAIGHQHLSYMDLIDQVKCVCLGVENGCERSIGEIDNTLFDRGDDDKNLELITEHAKKIIITQYKEMIKNKKDYSETCHSCRYRANEQTKSRAWPCQHFMMQRQIQGMNPLLTIDDIPIQGIISDETITFGKAKSDIYNISIIDNDPVANVINKAFKSSNFRPGKAVDMGRRKKKQKRQLDDEIDDEIEILEKKELISFDINRYDERLIGNEYLFQGDCISELIFNNYLKYLNAKLNKDNSEVLIVSSNFSTEVLSSDTLLPVISFYNIKHVIIPREISNMWMIYLINVVEKEILKFCTFNHLDRSKDESFVAKLKKLSKIDKITILKYGTQTSSYESGYYCFQFIETLFKDNGFKKPRKLKMERCRFKQMTDWINEVIC